MNTTPLTSVDESKLIEKYRNFIMKEVYEFCIRICIDNTHPFYEDLITEAQIAFIDECRNQNVSSLNLSAWQHACLKRKMKTQMRVAFWYFSNMGGYNTKKIDTSRSYTFTDFESDNDAEFESRVPSYSIDDTKIDLESFYMILPDYLRATLRYISAGYTDTIIAEKLDVSIRVIGKWRRKAGNLYLDYLASAM